MWLSEVVLNNNTYIIGIEKLVESTDIGNLAKVTGAENVVKELGECSMPASLRIDSLRVPTPAVTGDSVLLRCVYELANEKLYAVKWYKDEREFFRYVPAAEPPLKMFPQKGVDVDMSRSDKHSIYLRNLSLESFGNYTCQVSTDRPFFRCVQTTRPLEVVVGSLCLYFSAAFRRTDSHGGEIRLRIGRQRVHTVQFREVQTCARAQVVHQRSAGQSLALFDPHKDLINLIEKTLKGYYCAQKAPSDLYDKETIVYPDQLESSSLALRFRLKPDVLHNGRVVLKCVATVKHIHAVTIKEIRAAGSKEARPLTTGLFLTALSFIILRLTRD
ncbi:uncharacterized protein CDAR_308571 [Caerostris darwini]|uniref:Ig-like domain-containing protein n=1 Tax=Caerostris darwini TaxID=1538125 RepID=A0AAV4VCH9_9ARAC|nr:uncharacterized protein CDAR_308571 [Caerostris darwini]